MHLKIMSNNIEFELSRNTKNTDVILRINVKEVTEPENDAMTISICLVPKEVEALKKILEA